MIVMTYHRLFLSENNIVQLETSQLAVRCQLEGRAVIKSWNQSSPHHQHVYLIDTFRHQHSDEAIQIWFGPASLYKVDNTDISIRLSVERQKRVIASDIARDLGKTFFESLISDKTELHRLQSKQKQTRQTEQINSFIKSHEDAFLKASYLLASLSSEGMLSNPKVEHIRYNNALEVSLIDMLDVRSPGVPFAS